MLIVQKFARGGLVAVFVTVGSLSPASATTAVQQLHGVSAALETQIIAFTGVGWSREGPVAADSIAHQLRTSIEARIATPGIVVEVAARSWRKTGGPPFFIELVEMHSTSGALENLDQRLLTIVQHGQSSLCINGSAVKVIASLGVPNSYFVSCPLTPRQGLQLIYWIKDHELALMYVGQGSMSSTEFQKLAQQQYNAMGTSGSPLTLIVAAAGLVVLLLAVGYRHRRRRRAEPSAEITALPSPPQLPVAGWYGDPEGRPEPRFWDGTAWSTPSEPSVSKTDAPTPATSSTTSTGGPQ